MRYNQTLFEHKIPLKDTSQPPPRRNIYPLDSEEFLALLQKIKKFTATNHVRPSDSPYGAPNLFAKMKCGGLHMCIDYGALNKIMVADLYPLLHIDEILIRLKRARYFFHLDLQNRYHQLPIAEYNIPKQLFLADTGLLNNQ